MKYFVSGIKILALSILILFLLPLLNTRYKIPNTSAYAQNVSLGIFPPILQIQATPPTDIKSKIMIENLANNPVTLNIGVKPFAASPSENGQIVYPTDYSPLLADPFIFDKIQMLDGNNSVNQITLSPGQKKELTLEISLPQNEIKGDYYFSIIFMSSQQAQPNSNVSGTLAGVATNVLLSIGPQGPTRGYIDEFSAPPLVANGPVPFTVKIKNTSDHFITPKGDIVIKNMFGQTVGKISLLPVNILAASTRAIPDSQQSPSANPPASLKSYFLSLKSPAAVWPETILFGPYTATLTIALSGQGPLYKRTINFYAFPVESLLAFLIIILILVAIISKVRKTADKI